MKEVPSHAAWVNWHQDCKWAAEDGEKVEGVLAGATGLTGATWTTRDEYKAYRRQYMRAYRKRSK